MHLLATSAFVLVAVVCAIDVTHSTDSALHEDANHTRLAFVRRLEPEIWARDSATADRARASDVAQLLGAELVSQLSAVCGRCLYNTLTNHVSVRAFGRATVVLTGDIPAMWVRDSAVQMAVYLPRIKHHSALRAIHDGALRAQAFFILQDPWANAYNPAYVHGSRLAKNERILGRGGWVWNRNFELDSSAYFFNYLWNYFQTATIWHPAQLLRESTIHDAVTTLLELLVIEQRHEQRSPYRYSELPREGLGPACSNFTGMVWTAFRPSDDPARFSFNVPANMYLWGALARIVELNHLVWQDDSIRQTATNLMNDVQKGIAQYGVVEVEPGVRVYAYEVDGLGGVLADFDDPNLPSLLSIPLLGFTPYDKTIYRTTRSRILSAKNGHYFAGTELHGLGSPHTPSNYVWPLAIATRALTSDNNATEIAEALRMLLKTAVGNGLIHESVDVSQPSAYTRPEFGWANAMFVVAVEQMLATDCEPFAQRFHLETIEAREKQQPGGVPNQGPDLTAYYERIEHHIMHAKRRAIAKQ
jgi:meiotically up-regulated gene 157 (Mug157) protein